MQMTRNEGAGNFTLSLESELRGNWQSGQKFIDEMKELVCKSDRSYDPDTKVWTIGIGHYKAVYDLYQKYFVPANQLGLGI